MSSSADNVFLSQSIVQLEAVISKTPLTSGTLSSEMITCGEEGEIILSSYTPLS